MTLVPNPSAQRLTELFLALARIPSPSGEERAVGDFVLEQLASMGIGAAEDGTGDVIGGSCGNIVCTVGDTGEDPCVALGAHLDTVPPSGALLPALDDSGCFRNEGGGILGADDKASVAALLHAAELLLTGGDRFPAFELFFTVSEENGLIGAKHLAPDALRSPMAAVLDATGPVGGIVSAAPSQKIISGKFKGTAAHAGIEPENGRSAVQAAARAIAAMNLGRLDAETTANIGTICGGTATNVVPDACEIAGECRGHEDERLARIAAGMVDAIQLAAVETGVDVDVDLVDEFRAFRLAEDLPVVETAKRAITGMGLTPQLQTAGGGSDANVLNGKGIPCVNLATGMMRAHSDEEYITLDELVKSCEMVLRPIMEATRADIGTPDSTE